MTYYINLPRYHNNYYYLFSTFDLKTTKSYNSNPNWVKNYFYISAISRDMLRIETLVFEHFDISSHWNEHENCSSKAERGKKHTHTHNRLAF